MEKNSEIGLIDIPGSLKVSNHPLGFPMPGELGELAFRFTEFYASFRRAVGHAVFSDNGKT